MSILRQSSDTGKLNIRIQLSYESDDSVLNTAQCTRNAFEITRVQNIGISKLFDA